MARASHHDLVASQFGATAQAYVSSTVHSSGPDLEQIEALGCDRPGARALDLGCGGGHVALRLSQWVTNVVAYDLSPEMLLAVAQEAQRQGRSNITCQQGPVEKLPFLDASFDIVASRYSAHHWHDVPAGLAEARRVLKPGGVFVMADLVGVDQPLHDTWLQTIELLRDPSHARSLTVSEWRDLLAAAGFKVTDVVLRKLRIDFPSWTKRIGTTDLHIQALRSLHGSMPAEVAAYFEFDADGSFTADTALLTAE